MDSKDQDATPQRRVTLTANTAVTVSLALILQCAYVVYAVGRQAEKLDNVAVDVREIKATQYSAKEAQRDLTDLRREDERINVNMRELDQKIERVRAAAVVNGR